MAYTTTSKLVLWAGYSMLVFALSRTLPLAAVAAIPVLLIIARLRKADRKYLMDMYVRKVLVFSLYLFAGLSLVTAAGEWPSDIGGILHVGAVALLKALRLTVVLVALCLILATSTATAFYRELKALGVPPHWRATLLPAALYPKTLLNRFGIIREAQTARGIDPRAGILQRPRIFVTSVTLLLLGTMSNIPDRAAILSMRGMYLPDPTRPARPRMSPRELTLLAGGAAGMIAAVLIWAGVFTP